jgi:phage/plasmid-associated DNA primase
MEQTSVGKILFKNGIYDFNTRTFTHEYDPNIYFHSSLKYNFPTAFSDEDMLYVKQKLFTDPLGDNVGQYLLQSLARALAGYIGKHIFFCIGAKGDNGKSLLILILQIVLGGLFGTFAGENLSISKSSDDEARRWRWAFLLRGKRIIMSSELNMNANADGVITKKLSSGGDAIIGRGHGGNETSFAPTFTTFVFANDIPPITPHDEALDKRIRAIPYNISFVDREPVGEFEKRKDEGLGDKLSSDRYGLALIGLLISAYIAETPATPSEVSEFKKIRIGDSDENSPVTLFLDEYEITGNPDDFVLSSTIVDWNSKHKTGKSDKGFLILLKNRAEKMGKSIAPYRTSKIRGWSGLKQISDNINDECQI